MPDFTQETCLLLIQGGDRQRKRKKQKRIKKKKETIPMTIVSKTMKRAREVQKVFIKRKLRIEAKAQARHESCEDM